MAESASQNFTISSTNLVLLILAVLVFIKLFIWVDQSAECADARNAADTDHAQLALSCEAMSAEKADVDSSLKPTIYYHYTEWCGYCKKMKPMWNNIKARMSDRAFFIENDEDKNRTPNVNSYPTVMAHIDGQQLKYDGGYVEEELTAFVQNAIDMKAAAARK